MIENALQETGIALAILGALLTISCLFIQAGSRFGIPLALIFLGVGMLAGSDGLGGIGFEDYSLAYVFGATALAVILFSGGLHASYEVVRLAAVPAGLLATAGVLGVAGLTALFARLFGFTWPEALVFGAIMSSTDAAAVFALFNDLALKKRVAATLELESGLNDPMAVILTFAMTSILGGTSGGLGENLIGLCSNLGLGLLVGVAAGFGGRTLLAKVRPPNWALYPTLALALCLMTFGVASAVDGSGFLAVYAAGMIIGESDIPAKKSILEVNASIAWLAQISMFLMLGLLVFPSRLPGVAVTGISLALCMAFVARPLPALACLLFYKGDWKERLFIAWTGLRGAMPIILATVPILALSENEAAQTEALDIFNIVFFVVLAGSIIPGATARPLARLLGLLDETPKEHNPSSSS